MTSSLKKLAIQGAVWTIVSYGSRQVLRLVNNLILTRLLVPEFFGLMALANTLKMGIELFSDYGISQSIVNNKRGEDPLFLNTAWTLQIIRGFQIWLISLLLTYPVTNFYQDDRFMILVPLVGFTSVLDGFSSTAMHSLQRRMDIGRLMLYELTLQTITFALMTFACWLYPSVWSLSAGLVIGSTLHMIASHLILPGYRNRLAWEPEVLYELRSFGKWMAIASATMFLAEQADRILLGKFLSFQMLGVYTIAYSMASIPREMIRELSSRVIFPTISQQLDIPRAHLRAKIIKQRWLILIGIAVCLALLTCFGDGVIMALYQGRNKNWLQYQDATWMMPILCTGIWFSVLFYTTSPALLAIGKPLYSAQSNLGRFLMVGLGLPLAYSQVGVVGAIVIIALSDFPLYAVNLHGLRQEKLLCISQDIQSTVLFVGLLMLFLSVRYFLGFGVPIHALLNPL